jgi:hypothetical protein
MDWLFSTFSQIVSGLGIFATPLFIWLFYRFLIQRKAQQYDIPPLDKIDQVKIDGLVSQQVEKALKPLLKSNGYSEEEIKSILVKNSLKQSFKR